MTAAMPRAPKASFCRAGWLVLAASLALAPRAHAQTNEELSRARNEFREAIALQAAGDYAGALSKLHAVAAVRMTPQVRFNIAVCEKHLGKLVTALGNFTLAQGEALDQDLADVASKAEEHINDINARMPKLTIVRGEGAEAASIALDGVELGSSVIGTEMNVDPGPHTVIAKKGGEVLYSKTVEMAEKGSVQIVIAIESQDAVASPEPDRASFIDLDVEPSGWSKRDTGWVAIGAGGASAVAGVVFLVMRSGTISDLDAVCQNGRCPASAESTADNGKLYTGLAGATLALGAVGLGLGGYLLFGDSGTAEKAELEDFAASSSKPGLAFTLGSPGASAGASFVGSF